MDNIQTGQFIKERRKEKGLTQMELAQRLHITDRAVSKWERGLCAPDIALLAPLAEVLDVTIAELLAGKRAAADDDAAKIESAAKTVIDYSQSEIVRKIRQLKRKHIIAAAAALLAIVLLLGSFLWQRGYFFVIDKCPAPDGSACATVYNKALGSRGFTAKNAISLIVELPGDGELRITYGDRDYQGLWWAPDGQKYVLALEGLNGGTYLALASLEHSSERNLTAYLSMGVAASELANSGYSGDSMWPDISYQFLQWSKDSRSILIYYSFADVGEEIHEGYFWYNCESGAVSAVLEMEMQ